MLFQAASREHPCRELGSLEGVDCREPHQHPCSLKARDFLNTSMLTREIHLLAKDGTYEMPAPWMVATWAPENAHTSRCLLGCQGKGFHHFLPLREVSSEEEHLNVQTPEGQRSRRAAQRKERGKNKALERKIPCPGNSLKPFPLTSSSQWLCWRSKLISWNRFLL